MASITHVDIFKTIAEADKSPVANKTADDQDVEAILEEITTRDRGKSGAIILDELWMREDTHELFKARTILTGDNDNMEIAERNKLQWFNPFSRKSLETTLDNITKAKPKFRVDIITTRSIQNVNITQMLAKTTKPKQKPRSKQKPKTKLAPTAPTAPTVNNID